MHILPAFGHLRDVGRKHPIVSTDAPARPRPPAPPFPELGGAALFHEGFDWVYGMTNVEVTVPGYGRLRESWSGYALQRSGTVTPFIVPAVDAAGHTNVASHSQAAAVRFWLTPYWASQSAGGAGPGAGARLVELIAADGKGVAVAWSLQVTADGNALVLLDESDTKPVELLCVPIAWESTAHCIALNFGPGGTALFVDGQWMAQGKGTVAVPPTLAGLVFGSSWSGNASAEGDLEEIDVFGRWLTEQGMGFYFAAYHNQAALGPVSEAEWQAQREAIAKRKSEQSGGRQMMTMDSGGPPDPGGGGGGGGTNCPCNTLTNFTVGYLSSTNGLALGIAQTTNPWIALTIQTATNATYDMFGTTNLAGLALPSLGRTNWTWLTRVRGGTTNFSWGLTNWCERYFQLGTMQDSDNDGLTDAYEKLVSKTSPTNANSPRVLYETAISNQNPSAWFKLNDTNLADAQGGQSLTNGGGAWDPDAFAIGNSSFSFTNANDSDRLTVGDVISGGDGSSKGSISLLFRSLSGLATTRRYVFWQDDTSNSKRFGVFFEDDNGGIYPGNLCVQIGGQTNAILGSNAIVFGAWYHLAITWDETRVDTNGAEVAWYLGRVGGTLTNGTINLSDSAVVGNNNTVHLGNRDGLTRSFRSPGSGALDEIAFWNRELTNTEVNAQFNTLTPFFQGPSKVFDLTRWNLLLPVDKTNGLNTNNLALTITTGWLNSGFKYLNPTNWKQQYFYLSNGNQMVFEAPWNGARSSTNGGPRSELRGTKADGSEDNWKPYDATTGIGTNILQASCAVDAVTNSKVIIGQIHAKTPPYPSGADDGVPAITLYFDSRVSPPAIKLAVYWNPSGAQGTNTKSDFTYSLVSGVQVNDRIDYQLKLIGTSAGAVTNYAMVSVNGGTTFTNTVSMTSGGYSGWGATNVTLYFKAGCYYPDNPGSGTAKVTFSSLTATHQP